jgi:hypothetical protein
MRSRCRCLSSASTRRTCRLRDNPPGLEKEHIDRRIELAPGGATFTFRAVVHFRNLNDQDIATPVNVAGSAQRMAIVHI